MTSDRSKPFWRDTVFELCVVAPRVLERIGYTLVLFASIVFATFLVFTFLVALALVGSSSSTTNLIASLTPILVIATGALTGGIIAVVASKIRDASSGR